MQAILARKMVSGMRALMKIAEDAQVGRIGYVRSAALCFGHTRPT
jgi:hypothetical protein